MHIMLMVQCYAPEEISAAVISTELATDLVTRGHQVSVITIAPNYPYGKVFPGYQNKIYQVEYLDDVKITRTWSFISTQKTFWRRIFLYGSYCATSFYGGLAAGKPDILVSFSPPLPLGITADILSSFWKIPWVLQIEDLFPEAAVAAGMLQNQFVIDFFTRMAKYQYQRASHISVISHTFKNNIINYDIPDEKISIIPVWADPNLIKPLPKENSFRKIHDLDGKFVVLYSGNIGVTSCLEDIIQTANILHDISDIYFVIVGDGLKKDNLVNLVEQHELTNVKFLPYQPREFYPEVLAAADISLVTINEKSQLSSLPSKLFNIMASARPSLAIAPATSELSHIIEETKCGIIIPPGNPELIANTLIELIKSPEQLIKLGNNGRFKLEQSYSKSKCIDRYEEMLKELCLKHQPVYA